MSSGTPAAPSSFGAALCAWRTRAGLSYRQLARKVHYSPGHLCQVENGVKPPTPELARQLDAVLRAGGQLARLVAARRPRSPATGAGTGTGEADPGDPAGDDDPATGDQVWVTGQ